MPAIPLGLKSYNRASGFQPEVRLVNFVIEQDDSGASVDGVMRVQRPGLDPYMTLDGSIRGIFQKDNVLGGAWLVAHGSTLSSILPTMATIGPIGGDELVSFAATFDAIYVLALNTVKRWNGTAFTEITLPDDYLGYPVDIETINSYVIIACSTGRFYWIEPGSSVVDPLNFATAESSPDGLLSVRRLIDELFFGGTTSIEPWQPSGDLDAPFQKAGGRQFERGVLDRDTMQRFDNSIVWVGEDEIVYRVGSVPTRISDHGIEERLRKRTGPCSAWVFGADGHKYYVLRIPGQGAFAHDASSGGAWSEFATAGRLEWAPASGASSPAMTLAGDSNSGKLWRVDADVATDDGVAQPRIVTGTVPMMGKGGRNSSLAVSIGAADDCIAKIRWKDGQEDYPAYYEEMDVRAGADVVNLYRLGAIDEPFRTFEVRIDDPTMVRISGASINEAYR